MSVIIFANGFEHRTWQAVNCDRCPLGYDEGTSRHRCDLEKAIDMASWDTGEVRDEVLARLGWKDENRFILGWPCAERQRIEELGVSPCS